MTPLSNQSGTSSRGLFVESSPQTDSPKMTSIADQQSQPADGRPLVTVRRDHVEDRLEPGGGRDRGGGRHHGRSWRVWAYRPVGRPTDDGARRHRRAPGHLVPPATSPGRPKMRRSLRQAQLFAHFRRCIGVAGVGTSVRYWGGWGSTTRPGPGANSKQPCPAGRSRRARPGESVVERRWRRAGVESQAPAVRGADRPDAGDPARLRAPTVPYAELHCHSNFSFLDGASHPEELAIEAARLGLEALGDHRPRRLLRRGALRRSGQGGRPPDGVRHRDRAVGARHPVGPDPRPTRSGRSTPAWSPTPSPRPVGHPPARARRRPRRLRPALAGAQHRPPRRGEGGAAVRVRRPRRHASRGHGWVLTGLPQGGGPGRAGRRRTGRGTPRAAAAGRRVRARPGARRAVGPRRPARLGPQRRTRRDSPTANESSAWRPTTSTTPPRRNAGWPRRSPRCARGAASTRSTRGCPAAAGAHLRSGAEQARRFRRYPGVVERAAEIGRAAAFDLSLVAPKLPPFPCPRRRSLTEMQYLRRVTEEGARRRYGDGRRAPPPHWRRRTCRCGPGRGRRSTTSWR